MSLTDLEIRKHTAPLRAELDRQKEKCARMKRERDELRDAAEASISHCRMGCTTDSYCGQCEPLVVALKAVTP